MLPPPRSVSVLDGTARDRRADLHRGLDLDRAADCLDLLELVLVALVEQTIRKRPVLSSGSGISGRPRISSQPSRSISNGFMRTSEAGNGQLLLCWSIALEIASRFFASARHPWRKLAALHGPFHAPSPVRSRA